jgi:hypothetical protein
VNGIVRHNSPTLERRTVALSWSDFPELRTSARCPGLTSQATVFSGWCIYNAMSGYQNGYSVRAFDIVDASCARLRN